MQNTSYSCPILMKPEFSRKIFEKFSNIRVYKNVKNGSRVVPRGWMDRQTDRQTDRHDEAKSRAWK